MDVIDSLADLFHDSCYFVLSHWLGFFELMVELSSCPHFQDDINVVRIFEKSVHFDDVGVM